MSRGRHNHNRAIPVQIVGALEAKIGRSVKPVVLESPWVDASSGCVGKTTVVDKAMLFRGNKYGDARKVRYATDVIPMSMREENETQSFPVVARGIESIGGWL